MNSVLILMAWNASVAALLALVIWCLTRLPALRHRPALCHGLWLLVLAKLVVPPLVPLRLLPADSEPAAASRASAEAEAGANMGIPFARSADRTSDIDGRPAVAAPPGLLAASQRSSRPRPLRELVRYGWREARLVLLGISLAISAAIWLAAARQLRQVRLLLLLRARPVESGRVAELLNDVSRRFQLHRVPRLFMVDASITPMLWAERGRPAIVLPRQLADSLHEDQLRFVLGHEMAHFARRDHLANLFAFSVTSLFWWNPVAWFARRELAAAAEASCDALALERLAGSRKSYARTLLAVIDFVSAADSLQPVLGVGFGRSHSLRRRFEMLASRQVRAGMSRAGWALIALAAASLTLVPARGEEKPKPADTPAEAQSKSTDGSNTATPTEVESTQPGSAEEQFVIGTVYDKATRKPVAGAEISVLVDGELEPVKRLLKGSSNEQGRYRIAVPLGSFKLWGLRLPPGYWLSDGEDRVALTTAVETPLVTHDFALKPGIVWPIRLAVEGDAKDLGEPVVFVVDLEDEAIRKELLVGADFSVINRAKGRRQTWRFALDDHGSAIITQGGETGRAILYFAGRFESLTAEIIAEPRFNATTVKSIDPIAGTDRVVIVDDNGAKATISKATVTLKGGLPLLTFHAKRRQSQPEPQPIQNYTGRLLDLTGNPVADARVGIVRGQKRIGSHDTGRVVTTDQDGRFILEEEIGDENEVLRLVMTKDGLAGADSRDISFPGNAGPTVDLGQFVLREGYALPVRVVDENDKPLAGAVIEPLGSYAVRRQVIRTDAQGRGVLRNLPSGVVRASASYGDRYKNAQLFVSPSAAENLEVILKASPAVAPVEAPSDVRPKTPQLAVDQDAPQWALNGWSDGQQRKLADLRGKVVVLDFWGMWCHGCVEEIPELQKLAEKYDKPGVVFLGIHTPDGDMDQIKKLQQSKGWTAPTALDVGGGSAGETASRYGINGYPALLIIGADGKIVFNEHGMEPAQLRGELKKAAESAGLPWPEGKAIKADEWAALREKLIFVVRCSQIEKALAAVGR